ncbi:unnamed protein product [Paramecium sonneborni]|uniref:WD40-repeat-containing domain n=1 Tax=Paramecium sonneborni TaxID=65129 RepID=A0A8S1MHW3_9CILI|nr:unnamed protein product [Paramecium sonneborni]
MQQQQFNQNQEQQQQNNQNQSNRIEFENKFLEAIRKSNNSRDRSEQQQMDNNQISYQSNSGQRITSIKIIDQNQQYDCTAIAFHPKVEQYLAVAVGNKVLIYNLQINQGLEENDESRPGILRINELNEQQIITALNFLFYKVITNYHDIIVGTNDGIIHIARYRPQNYQQGTNNLIIENRIQNIGTQNHIDQISCILTYTYTYTFQFDDLNSRQKEEIIILTSSYDGQILQFSYEQIKEENEEENQQSIQNFLMENKGKQITFQQEAIYWISLSDITGRETQNLIASGYENYFYIWERKQNQIKWKFISKYKRYGVGTRVAFFGSSFIVWQIFQKDYINILQNLHNWDKNPDAPQTIKAENVIKVEFNEEYIPNQAILDNDKFPLLLNNQSQDMLMGIKYGKNIHFLKGLLQFKSKDVQRQLNLKDYTTVKFSFLKEYVECGLNCTEGAISPSCNNIAIYDNQTKQIKIYNTPLSKNK